jgi:diguanylate cyclase (GGDEF)-like protein
MIVRAVRWLQGRTSWQVGVAAALLAILLGIANFASGVEISFALFYMLPVTIAAWLASRRVSIGVALVTVAVWFISNRLAGQQYSSVPVFLWNVVTGAGFYLVLALSLSALRRSLAALRSSLEREASLARSDALTGIKNGRAFYELATIELGRAVRYHRPITFAYVDADGFKTVNDTMGHRTGDRVLCAVATTLDASLRRTDLVARLGGDEFAMLLPETDETVAREVLRKVNEELGETMRRGSWNVTFSVGVVTCRDVIPSVDDLVQAGDRMMYEAKHTGKNAMVFGRWRAGAGAERIEV